MAEILMSLNTMPSLFSMQEEVVSVPQSPDRPMQRLARLSREALERTAALVLGSGAIHPRHSTSAAAW